MADRNTPPKGEMNWARVSKTLSFWILIILIPFAFIKFPGARSEPAPTISYSEYDAQLARGNITKVNIQAGKQITGEFRDKVVVVGATAPSLQDLHETATTKSVLMPGPEVHANAIAYAGAAGAVCSSSISCSTRMPSITSGSWGLRRLVSSAAPRWTAQIRQPRFW